MSNEIVGRSGARSLAPSDVHMGLLRSRWCSETSSLSAKAEMAKSRCGSDHEVFDRCCNPRRGLARRCAGSLCVRTFIKEMLTMRLHRKLTAVLAASLALVVWGCNSEQVESGADATARGLDKAGGAMENAGKKLGDKLEHAGEGTKLERAAHATGVGLEKAGEKTHEVLDKAGEKIKDAAPAVGKAVDKAGEKIKDIEHKVADKAKDLGKSIKEEASDLKEKAGEKIKDLKDKASDALNKDKAPGSGS